MCPTTMHSVSNDFTCLITSAQFDKCDDALLCLRSQVVNARKKGMIECKCCGLWADMINNVCLKDDLIVFT